jgi:hypothetical protein
VLFLGKRENKQNEQTDSQYINVDEVTHEDLLKILDKVAPNLPANFKLLKMPERDWIQGVRWDPDLVSILLSLWSTSPANYELLRNCDMFLLPSERILQYYKNVVDQQPGFFLGNLRWMLEDAKVKNLPSGGGGGIANRPDYFTG